MREVVVVILVLLFLFGGAGWGYRSGYAHGDRAVPYWLAVAFVVLLVIYLFGSYRSGAWWHF